MVTQTHSGTLSPAASLLQSQACSQCPDDAQVLPSKGRLRRAAIHASSPAAVPPIVHEVLHSPSHLLDDATRAFMEPRFGYDFSRVRVHTDARAAEAAWAVSAAAYTVGGDIVFGHQQYAPHTTPGLHLLAHELAHVLQQEPDRAATEEDAQFSLDSPNAPAERAADVAGTLLPGGASFELVASAAQEGRPHGLLQRSVDEPRRYQHVYGHLFSRATGGLLPWQEPAPGVEGTAAVLRRQARANILTEMATTTIPTEAQIPTRTTEAAADAEAVDTSARVRNQFHQISATVNEQQIRQAVSVMTPAVTTTRDYLRQYTSNRMPDWSDREKYDVAETDPRYTTMLDTIIDDPAVGTYVRRKAQLVAGFQRGEGTAREIFIHRGAQAGTQRTAVLVHEFTHYFSHPIYREWVAQTDAERFYNEGFTEYLARQAMTPTEQNLRGAYDDRVEAIQTRVAQHVPDSDIASAYFAGEVWRIETRSEIARREFTSETGLAAKATAQEETATSRVGPGISETVVPGQRYRFMNLGFDQFAAKPEHVAFFRRVKIEYLDPVPAFGVRFIGHASSAGPRAHNLRLSLRRAQAFYQMAADEGVAQSRLIDVQRPPHEGETRLTAEEEDPATRAFNRRVEMTIQPTTRRGGED